ncbi:hypothetical protein ANN_03426 [Periplaneta americana]|uniref:Uncharacterized protein n=1 Tax=Periplaneta americana TaxID=6978 RepID=A0ABQ8U058_PERAM|nr:hypothetical protein ANN_03426 [Periplaneta americana]
MHLGSYDRDNEIFLRLYRSLINKVLHVAPKEKVEELNLATVVAKDLDNLDLSTFPRMFGGDVRGRQMKSHQIINLLLNNRGMWLNLNRMWLNLVLNNILLDLMLNKIWLNLVMNKSWLNLVMNKTWLDMVLNTIWLNLILNKMWLNLMLSAMFEHVRGYQDTTNFAVLHRHPKRRRDWDGNSEDKTTSPASDVQPTCRKNRSTTFKEKDDFRASQSREDLEAGAIQTQVRIQKSGSRFRAY